MDLISVIVPVYKVEEYLDRCVQSIADQTYRNLEIILVDDGSPDNCPAMCDAWAQKDGRIRVIHKENGGLSDARNAGMAVASGEFLCFVDSDDRIHPEYVNWLHRACLEHHADISACNFLFVHNTDTSADCCSYQSQSYSVEEALAALIHGQLFRAVAWNKLFRRVLLEGEQFPIGRYHEDEFFSYRILGKADRLAYVDTPLYYYLQRDGSIMRTVSVRHLDALDAGLERIAFLDARFPRLSLPDRIGYCTACINFYIDSFRLPRESRTLYQEKIRQSRSAVTFSPGELFRCSSSEQLRILGSKFCIGLLCKILSRKRSVSIL